MEPRRHWPLASAALDSLRVLLTSSTTTREDLEAWIWTHTARTRRRELQLLHALVDASSDALAGSVTQDVRFWRPEFEHGSSAAVKLSSRLVAAHLNADAPMVDALTATWVSSSAEERGDVVRELIGAIVHRR